MSEKHEVAKMLKAYAIKLASGGRPDRMTTADGQGGITAHNEQVKKDPAVDDLKADLPADSSARTSDKPAGSPDRMTTADGQGGITASNQQVPKDPGEADLKADLPSDGAVRKSANDRISRIRQAISGKAAAGEPVAKSANATPAAATTMPAADLSPDVLAKIASAVLSTEEGIGFVHSMFEKQAGEAAARSMIQEAILSAEQFDTVEQVKSAAFEDVFSKAAAIHADLSQIITEEDADSIRKTAAIHQAALMELDHPLLKAAYAAGMDDAAGMEAAEDEGGEGAADAAMPMGGEQLSEEEILALLQEMIASGEITEEDVAAALQASEGGEGAAAAGAPVA